jgi:hypothetical protein
MDDQTKYRDGRRKLLASGGAAFIAGALGTAGVRAGAEEHAAHTKGMPAVVIDASKEGICGTCRFWGGIRRVSEDKKAVYAESLGWCNNVDSPHFQTMRTPEAGPMKAWRKWEAL